MKFSDVAWGSDEAKGDSNLHSYFFEFPKFNDIKNGTYRYVIGRKGSGKTAIIEKIRQTAQDDPQSFYSTLTLRDFPINDLRSLRDKSNQDKSQFVPIWQFLIYIELSKLISKDESISSCNEAEELKNFLKKNNLDEEMGFSPTIKELKQSSSKINVLANWIGGGSEKTNSQERFIEIHYNKVVKILGEKIKLLKSSCEFWIFIDELDEGYQAGDSNLRLLLLALLRAVENCSIDLKEHIKFRPLLVLRSDIFDSLEDNDLNKLDDYTIRLKWSSASSTSKNDSHTYSLREVVSARIKNSIKNINNDPWESIVQEKDSTIPQKAGGAWKYITSRTYERPRDVIKFLKICSELFDPSDDYNNKLSFRIIKKAEDRYSAWLLNELRDEIQAHLSCWKEVFQCLTSIGEGIFSKLDLEEGLKRNQKIDKWLNENNKSTDDIIEMLFNFGVVGNLDEKRRWLFKYKDEDLSWNKNMDLTIHFGLQRKLRIRP